MSSHMREIPKDPVASHHTELSTDACLIRATEKILAVTEASEDEGVVKYLRFTDVSPAIAEKFLFEVCPADVLL
ncbi:uncharacterized protein N7525_009828 [Penicillium rubens]|uniref:uncharacterized protein n=1 Tax=Penicillium rubens TaxID=1108849 RepID=UPI002A5AA819|nr:uncharacterized protein N7525_009828 [Penicillium rubens]KAJ5831575.1 hypothetical protein N7525_009828 [Penicillium rubens]KAJ5855121.1 hypothetical protein N7534_007664 [Penicillium rubens]